MLHNNMMGSSHGPHGLSNHVIPPGIGAFHPNNVSTNFSGIHGLNANSLMDSKDGNSGEWFILREFLCFNFLTNNYF